MTFADVAAADEQQSPRSESRLRRIDSVAGLVSALAVALLCGYLGFYRMFTGFRLYDDEGAMLFVLDRLAKGNALYDQTVTVYGPVGFLPKLALVKLFALPINHDTGRFIGLVFWWLIAALLGAAIGRLARSALWFAITAAATFVTLQGLAYEPGHPQDACALILAIGLLVSTFGVGRHPSIFAALGAAAGLICLVKINLGLFFAGALWATIAVHLPPGPLRKVMLGSTAVGCAAGPFLLMGDSLGEGWPLHYALTVSCSLLGCLVAAMVPGLPFIGGKRILVLCLGGFVLALAAVCGLTIALGTSVGGLLEGVIFLPLRLPGTFRIPFELPVWIGVPPAALGFMLAIAMGLNRSAPRTMQLGIGLLRAGGGLLLLALILGFKEPQAATAAAYGSLLMPLLLLPRSDGRNRTIDDSLPRTLLAFSAVVEVLWAYPVAGSQQYFACLLLATGGCILLADGIDDLIALRAARRSLLPLRLAAASAVALLSLGFCVRSEMQARTQYASEYAPLRLPGCDWIRVPPEMIPEYRLVVAQLKENADVLYWAPGLASFTFWTHVPPASPSSPSNWMRILTAEQQQAVIASLEASARPCVVLDNVWLGFWMQDRQTDSPLLRYINDRFRPAYRSPGKFQIQVLVRRDRQTFVVTDAEGHPQKVLRLTDGIPNE